jgi:hypothetical protein
MKLVKDHPLFSYESLVDLMNKRVITVKDWKPLIGKRQYIEAEGKWFPLSSPFFVSGAITEFVVRRVFAATDEVEILIDIDPLVPGGTLMVMNADLLALYCEAS